MRDVYVLAAAQWILSYGQSFFKQVLFPGDVDSDDLRLWKQGPRYDCNAGLSLQRWHFWRDGFSAKASRERGKEKRRGGEVYGCGGEGGGVDGFVGEEYDDLKILTVSSSSIHILCTV